MKATVSLPKALEGLPDVIWVPGSHPVAVYRGSPSDIVQSMASEMKPKGLPLRVTITAILTGLAKKRGIAIELPSEYPDDILASLFVYALLDTGICRRVPQA